MVEIKWVECLGYPTKLLPEQEFIGQIIDIFEDFLDDRKVILDNPERSEPGVDPESAANIYGTDYGDLQSALEELLANWGIMTWVEVKKNDPVRSNEGER